MPDFYGREGRAGCEVRKAGTICHCCDRDICSALCVVGPRAMDLQRPLSWLTDDPRAGYLGWLFFRHTDVLTFPLGWSPLIGHPFGQALAYLDSLPLVSTCLWLVRNRLPETFQFFGIYFVLCCILQMAFGYRISRHFLQDRWAALVGSLFFLTAPVFIMRSAGHFALASHWLILAAIDASLLLISRFSAPRMIYALFVLIITGGLHPYLTLMALGIVCASFLRSSWHLAVMGMALSVIAATASSIPFGFIRFDDFGAYKGELSGTHNADLLTFVDPQFPSALLLKSRQWKSHEAFGYLGLGILLLILVVLSRCASGL